MRATVTTATIVLRIKKTDLQLTRKRGCVTVLFVFHFFCFSMIIAAVLAMAAATTTDAMA